MNISLVLQMAADADAGRIGLLCEGRRWSYEALWRAANKAATRMTRSGCSHVALLDQSSEAAAIALFGAALAGIPYVPLNYRLADADLQGLLTRIAPAYFIGDVQRIERLGAGPGSRVFSRASFLAEVRQEDGGPVDAAAADAAAADAKEPAEEIAVQLFTSGTTAAPKAAVLRHANLLSYILGTIEFGAASVDEAALVSVPPYHIAGIAALLSSIYAMRRIVLMPAFEPGDWIALAAAERASFAFLVPTMLSRVIAHRDIDATADLSALRAMTYGGGRMPGELIARALELFPDTGFTNAYGLTETSSTIALLDAEEHRIAHASADPAVRARLSSVGRPLPTVQIEIRDEDGNALPAGERGEIYVRGDQVSGEYRERSALEADGWFPTRDAGYMDAAGYLFLEGRTDDVIVRGGENISPGEIEDVLLSHPAIADAAAVGIPSTEWGEVVAVAVVARPGAVFPGEEELRILIKDRLRSSRVPERIAVVDALPYNEMGKLLRREIRKLFKR